MFAVIETGGKQYKVSEGDKIKVEKLNAEEGSSFVFDKVLMTGEKDKINVGKPYIEKAKVEAKVLENGRHDKIIVFKFKRRKRYRKKAGHRQPFTQVQITKISG